MKYSKLIIAGLTAAITLNGAAAVFADDTTEVEKVTTQRTAAEHQNEQTDSREQQEDETDGRDQFFREIGAESGKYKDMEIDMSGLDLPEDFIPFDEAHVPDGINIPVNGELKPIEFDEEGNMIYGQRPPMFGETEGERPEFREGERPEFREGERPEFIEGERPEFRKWEIPEFEEGERPELPEGENPPMNGEIPEFQGSEIPEFQGGEMPGFQGGEMPEFPQEGSMQSGGQYLQMAGQF